MVGLLPRILVLSGAYALITVAVGWVAVPGVSLFWALLAPPAQRPIVCGTVAAGLGWLWLLLWNATTGEAVALAERAAAVLAIPGAGFVVLTLVFPMLLAWGTIAVATTLRGWHNTGQQGYRSRAGKDVATTASPVRKMLLGEVQVGGRTWTVKEEKRQGPRPQIFILTESDGSVVQMHVRPEPGHEVTTLEEVSLLGADPGMRALIDQDGLRWEASIVLSSGETGTHRMLKLLSFQANAAYEEPYTFTDGLGLRTDEEMQAALALARGKADGR